MDPIVQMRQDLARGEYAQTTRDNYLKTIQGLQRRFDKEVDELSREEVRTFVDETFARYTSSSSRRMALAAVVFLYRKTLGMPQHVSFIRWPKRYSPLPTQAWASRSSPAGWKQRLWTIWLPGPRRSAAKPRPRRFRKGLS